MSFHILFLFSGQNYENNYYEKKLTTMKIIRDFQIVFAHFW